jgi:hypothetical protein
MHILYTVYNECVQGEGVPYAGVWPGSPIIPIFHCDWMQIWGNSRSDTFQALGWGVGVVVRTSVDICSLSIHICPFHFWTSVFRHPASSIRHLNPVLEHPGTELVPASALFSNSVPDWPDAEQSGAQKEICTLCTSKVNTGKKCWNTVTFASLFRHQGQSVTAGHELVRHWPDKEGLKKIISPHVQGLSLYL